MHVVGGLVERRGPAHDHIGLVDELVGEVHHVLEEGGIEEEPKEGEAEGPHDPGAAALLELAEEHDEAEDQGVEEHEEEDGPGALIGPGHLQGLHEGRQGHRLPRPGVAQNGRGLGPHVAQEAVLRADQGRGRKDEQHIEEGGQRQVDQLPPGPGPPPHAHQVVGHPRAQKGHVHEQQHQQERDEQNGVGVPEGPHEGLEGLHGRAHVVGEGRRLVGQQEAEDEGQGEGEIDAHVPPPHAKVIPDHCKDLPELPDRPPRPAGPEVPLRDPGRAAGEGGKGSPLPPIVPKLVLRGQVEQKLKEDHQGKQRQRRALARQWPGPLHGEIVLGVQHEGGAEVPLLEDDEHVVEDEGGRVGKIDVLRESGEKQPHRGPQGPGEEEEDEPETDLGELAWHRPFPIDLHRRADKPEQEQAQPHAHHQSEAPRQGRPQALAPDVAVHRGSGKIRLQIPALHVLHEGGGVGHRA